MIKVYLTAKVWANLDNQIKSYDFFVKVLINFLVCYPPRWHSATISDVTTVQLSNGTVHRFHENVTLGLIMGGGMFRLTMELGGGGTHCV